MGNKINGTKSENRRSWHEKERCDSNAYPGRRRNVRHQSKSAGNQPQRAHRTYCQGSSYLGLGSKTNGGVIDNLIDEYRDQVAVKKAAIRTLELEIEKLESRIQNFEAVQSQLSHQLQEAS
ncbi:MAG: hypothetical protein RMX35_29565 [Nostoc sp. DcaGUA01]|nr:hypothetical protein [Nostoc sp. DcaGUA01]